MLLQHLGGAAQVIGPIPHFPGRDALDMPLRALRELQGGYLYHAVLLGGIGEMDALIDGEAGDLAEVMVGMRPDGADPVGTESQAVVIPAVGLVKTVFAAHVTSRG